MLFRSPLQAKAVPASGTVALAYKLVRPSKVTATTTGPDGSALTLDSQTRPPGTYRFTWAAAGHPAGDYTFRVTADDDQGRHSVAERDFTVSR